MIWWSNGEVKTCSFVMSHGTQKSSTALTTFSTLSNKRNQWGLSEVRLLLLWLLIKCAQFFFFRDLLCTDLKRLGDSDAFIYVVVTSKNMCLSWRVLTNFLIKRKSILCKLRLLLFMFNFSLISTYVLYDFFFFQIFK